MEKRSSFAKDEIIKVLQQLFTRWINVVLLWSFTDFYGFFFGLFVPTILSFLFNISRFLIVFVVCVLSESSGTLIKNRLLTCGGAVSGA